MRNNIFKTIGLVTAVSFAAGLAHGEYGETKLFENLKFQHSIGLITDEGHAPGSGFEGYANWGIWDTETGRLKSTYDEITKKFGIQMPTYKYLTHDEDPRIEIGGVRRPTHVTEHTLYAIPGEKIYLYPYTDFDSIHNRYHETFTRWYDYSTDKASKFLAFDNEFSDVIETEYGTLGGKSISAVDNTFIIANVEDYMEFVKRVNFGDVNLCAEITADVLDFGPYNQTKELTIGSKGGQNGKIPVTVTYDKDGKPLDPIGFYNKNLSGSNGEVFFTYTGTFNGNACVIKNLHINRYVEDGSFVYNQKLDVGMFGRVGAGARIYGLRIDPSCEFTGQERVGFIGGVYEDSKYDAVYIENVINHGDATADWKLGWSSKRIEGGEYAGGIFGGTQGSTDIFVRNCAATGNVKGYDGSIFEADVKDGKVTFSDPAVNVGGLAGFTGYNAMLDKDDNAITDGDPSKLIKADGSVRLTSITAFKNCYSVAKGFDGRFLPIRGNGNLGAIRLFDSYDPTRVDVNDYSINFWKEGDKKVNDKYFPYYFKGLYNCYSPVESDGDLHKGYASSVDKGYDHFDLEETTIDEKDPTKGMRKKGWYPLDNNSYWAYPTDLAEKLNNGQSSEVWKQDVDGAPTILPFEHKTTVPTGYTAIRSETEYINFVNGVNDGSISADTKAILMCDLDFSGKSSINPLGNSNHKFKGEFEGNGFTIRNLKISQKNDWFTGMFGYVTENAKIKNIIIDESCEFVGTQYVGFIGAIGAEAAFWNKNGASLEDQFMIVENVINNANVTGTTRVGGIYGGRANNIDIIVNNCASTGKISGTSEVGGIAGFTGYNQLQQYVIDNKVSKETWSLATLFWNCYTTAKDKDGNYLPLKGGGNLGTIWINRYKLNGIDKYKDVISEYAYEPAPGVEPPYDLFKYEFKGLYNCWSAIGETENTSEEKKIDFFGIDENGENNNWNELTLTKVYLTPDVSYDDLNIQNPEGTVKEENWEVGDISNLPQPKATDLDNIIHSEKRVVKIASVNDYIEFARRVNENHETDLDAELTANLDFKDISEPIPMIGEYKAYCYSGTFDGKGHTISNLKIDRPGQGVVGMFGWICGGAVIANLTIDESCSIRGMNTVGLAGSLQPSNASDKVRFFNIVMKGTVEGVETITGGVSDGEGYDIGGIFGKRGGTNVFVENCASLGTVKGRNVCTGAIAGHTGWNEWNMTVFENCLANAKGNYGEPLPLRANGNLGGQIKLTFQDFRVETRDSAVKYEYVEGDSKPHQYTYQGIINCYSAIGEASDDISKWYDNLDNATKILVEKRFTDVRDDNNKFVQGTDIFGDDQLHALPENMKSTGFAELLGKEWSYISTEETPLPDIHKVRFIPTRQGGAVATFLIPEGKEEEAFNEDGELYIALDISQTYSQDKNLLLNEEDGSYTLVEPIVAFRHIFTIKDARKFADEYSSTAEANEKYISERRRYVSARANDDFQIRLEFTVPTLDHTDEGRKYESLSSRYYKVSDGVYKRFGRSRLEAWKVIDGAEQKIDGWDKDNQKNYLFYFDEAYDAPDGEFWRMIACDKDKAEAGRYILKVFARDENDEDVTIPDGSGKPLQLTEFDITFLRPKEASFIAHDEIYDYDNGVYKFEENDIRYKQTEEYLEEHYDLLAKVDFDQYLHFQKALEGIPYISEDGTEITADGLQLSDFFQQAECRYDEYTKEDPKGLYYFKWPEPWGTSSYGFGYNQRREYSMYLVTNSAAPTPYHSAAHKRGTKFFDRNYYREYFKAAMEAREKTDEANEPEGAPRKVDESKDFGKGYYYYVNAAGDPGTITEFEIDELCPGATLYVSAWIAELTATGEPTTANVIFNFNAIMEDGSSQTLHSYVSGSVAKNIDNDKKSTILPSDASEQRGKWMHVYYQFVPNYGSLDRTKINHYELQLENNARNSHGADYAVDDVRVYGANLKVSARQNEPYCYTHSTKVQVGINFETLLASMGIMEANAQSGDTHEIYYTFLDKEKYDEIYLKEDSSDEDSKEDSESEILNVSKEAFESAVLKYEYDGEENGILPWGKMRFYAKYEENPEKATTIAANAGQVWRDTENTENDGLVMFHTSPYDEDMMPDKDYFIALYLPTDNTGNVDWADFEIYGLCARSAEFKVVGSTIVVANGVPVPTEEDITCCANQNPYVQVDLNIFNGEDIVTKEKAIVDWYDGNKEEFNEEKSKDGKELAYILKLFRTANSKFDGKDWTNVNFGLEGEDQMLTQDMIDYLKGMQEKKKLRLYQDFFLFRHKKEAEDNAVVVIPIDMYDQYSPEYSDVMTICTEPLEIPVKYQEPGINHGFADIDYPEAIDSDVPLRIGLTQLDNVSYGADDNENSDKKTLSIPLRGVKPVTEGVTELGKWQYREYKETDEDFSFDPQITLYDTDDPDCDLSVETVVGFVEDMKAILHDNGTDELGKNQDNTLFVTFDKNFKFREGYSYSLQFKYSEKAPAVAAAEHPENSEDQEGASVSDLEMFANQPPCGGFHVFTMRIVPEYQMWNGGKLEEVSDNWNADGNWTRVKSSDLSLPDTKKTGFTRFTTDLKSDVSDEYAVNGNETSFIPMDFTKVIVPSGADVPLLLEAHETATVRTWKNGNAHDTWTSWPKQVTPDENDLIQYEMEAYYRDSNSDLIKPGEIEDPDKTPAGIGCRPFYINTCEQIHFKPDTEIGNQRLLNYEKAWVDVELQHDKWYTLASPLQEIVAGDWYAPTKSARQESELFWPIDFDPENNHRFKPAVYQRAWNNASVKIYEFGKDTEYDEETGDWVFNEGVDKMVKKEWSHVYNDVTVDNGASGLGFSIKADASGTDTWDDLSTEEKKGYKTLFRLPKNDDEYFYHQHESVNPDADKEGSGHLTPIVTEDEEGNTRGRAKRHRLQDYKKDYFGNRTSKIEAKVFGAIHDDGETSDYFLVGNPFMAHLDMAAFLKENASGDDAVIEPMFWIMDGDSQMASVMTGNGLVDWSNDANENPFLGNDNAEQMRYLAPMQGFFVKAKADKLYATDSRRTLTIMFDEKTMTKVNLTADSSNRLKAKTRGARADALRISALVDGEEESQAVLRIDDGADAAFRSGEDVEMFDDDTQRAAARVFTFAGDMAALINQTPELTMTELALLAPEGKNVTLRFDGVDALGEAYLYDAREHSLTSIFDGMEYAVSGNVKSRLYITSGMNLTDMTDAISISASGNQISVTAPDNREGLTVTVSDMEGRIVFTERTPENGMTFSLPRGVFAVRASSGDLVKTEKLMMK